MTPTEKYRAQKQAKIDALVEKGLEIGNSFFYSYENGVEQLTISEISKGSVYMYRNLDKNDFKIFSEKEIIEKVIAKEFLIK